MKIIFLLILLGISAISSASTDFTPLCKSAYKEIISLRFTEAHRIILQEKKNNPSNTIPSLLENSIDFLTVMLSEEDKDLEILLNNREKRLQLLAKGDKKSPWFLYSQAEVYFQTGMARIKFQEYISGGMEINRAYRLLLENEKKHPGFLPAKARLGLLHCLVGTVPDKYKWAARALDFEGSIPQGISELNQAYKSSLANKDYDFLIPESLFLLSFATINMSGDRKATHSMLREFEKSINIEWTNRSPLMAFCLANLYLKTGQNDEAIKRITTLERKADQFPFLYLDYILGTCKLNRLDADAHLPLLKYVASFKGKNYIRSAYQYLAWYYLIQDNIEKYNVYMQRITLRGAEQVDNDIQALKNAEKGSVQDINLLKARLLFDGGYYDKSIVMLNRFSQSASASNPSMQLEYNYRSARVYDEWGKWPEAIKYYEITIKTGSQNASYFAANSALHMGMIMENRGKFKEAELYYRKCLEMDFSEYNFSISQKAKSGLNRLKNR